MNRLLATHVRRRILIALLCGAVALGAAASIAALSGPPADAGALRTGGLTAATGPGFAGSVGNATDPARDAAPPIAPAPLAGLPLAGSPHASSARPVYALRDHPLFAQHIGLGRVDCELPEWRDEPEAARVFYRAALGCLNAAWEPTLRGAGLPFRPPRLDAPAAADAVRSACPQDGRPASYCESDETIVIPYAAARDVTADSRRGAQLALLAQEYGHHIQHVVGVLRAYTERRTQVGWQTAAGQEQSRRLELQAGCFAGMFFGINHSRGDIDQRTWVEAADRARAVADRPGAPRLHGADHNVWGWWKWGSDKGDTWECNTWYADQENVE
ncbi:neutral zinc metallopeptidase [Nocardia sp. NPDC050713]|uniref:neutral zinc metallopeptidase n=1 Tax=Nocardia sp. NPDC050713 TaxID=3154511 RepID=UPI003407CA7D